MLSGQPNDWRPGTGPTDQQFSCHIWEIILSCESRCHCPRVFTGSKGIGRTYHSRASQEDWKPWPDNGLKAEAIH